MHELGVCTERWKVGGGKEGRKESKIEKKIEILRERGFKR